MIAVKLSQSPADQPLSLSNSICSIFEEDLNRSTTAQEYETDTEQASSPEKGVSGYGLGIRTIDFSALCIGGTTTFTTA